MKSKSDIGAAPGTGEPLVTEVPRESSAGRILTRAVKGAILEIMWDFLDFCEERDRGTEADPGPCGGLPPEEKASGKSGCGRCCAGCERCGAEGMPLDPFSDEPMTGLVRHIRSIDVSDEAEGQDLARMLGDRFGTSERKAG